jgi:hypothetical protein
MGRMNNGANSALESHEWNIIASGKSNIGFNGGTLNGQKDSV